MTLHRLAHQAAKLARDNSPLILTAFGVAGTVTTAVLSAKAGAKAQENLLYEAEHRGYMTEEYTFREKIELSWKFFIPPALTLVGTVSCIICASTIGTRRAAAMAAAYSLSEKAFVEYKDKVVEQIGAGKEQKVRDAVAQDRVTRDNVGLQEIFVTGHGSDLCMEMLTGRYFYSSMENIKHAVNRVNHQINRNYDASLNDFYDYLGLDHNKIGDELGWNTDRLMDVTFTTTIADGERPCLVLNYHVEPHRDYFRVN